MQRYDGGMRRGWAVAVVASIAGGALLLGACAGDECGRQTASNQVGADVSSAGGASRAEALVPKGRAAQAERKVIYTGRVTVRVDDASASARRAVAIAEDAGGYISSSDADLSGDHEVRGTLRVPADDFEDAMAAVGREGKVEDRSVDSQDVTDQVVDLEERLANAKASAQRLRELLAKAENLPNIIALEDRLTERETEIEALTGQIQGLDDQADLATIRATFTERDAPKVSDDLPGPLDALRAGAVTVVNLLLVALAVAAFLVPFAPFALLGWWLVRRRRRRRAARRPAPPSPPATQTPEPVGAHGSAVPPAPPADPGAGWGAPPPPS